MKYLLPIIFSCLYINSYAQITITKESFLLPWDTLYTAVDHLPANIQLKSSGGDMRWDFTSLQSPFIRQSIVRPIEEGKVSAAFPKADLVVDLGGKKEGYLNVDANAVELMGFYGEDPLGQGVMVTGRYTPPVVERRAPMNFFDVNQFQSSLSLSMSMDDITTNFLNRLPITPDSLRIQVFLDRLDMVDSWGTLTIPGGIYDILREKRTEIRETHLQAKIGFQDWFDITDIAIQLLDLAELGKDTLITYHYFSQETKEPIAVVRVDHNNKINNIEYRANDRSSDVQNINNLKPGVYAFPNPAIVNVRFEFTNLDPGKYQLKIYNILGVEVWQKDYNIKGFQIKKENISSLRKGTYLYSLINEHGKTITTRRLIVVRP